MARLHPQGAEGLLSRRSARFRDLGLDGRRFREDELLDLLAQEPKLLRRPLLTDGRHLVVGYDARALEGAFGAGA